MELKTAIDALAALAQESRLKVFRLLVQAGPDGLAATEIAEAIGIPANTLSFHVKTLHSAGLVNARNHGRYVFYSANYPHMAGLMNFLTESCCRGSEQRGLETQGSNAA